jgi:hypothetical protein
MPDMLTAVLVTGERRRIELPSRSGTVANALDRLDDWMPTADGGWIQTRYVVEVRPDPAAEATSQVHDELRDAAGTLAGLEHRRGEGRGPGGAGAP